MNTQAKKVRYGQVCPVTCASHLMTTRVKTHRSITYHQKGGPVVYQCMEMKIWVELTSALFQRFVICYHGGEDRSSCSVSDPDSVFCFDCIASSDFCFLFPYLLNLLPIHRSYSWVSRAFSFPPWCFCCLSLFFIYSFFSLQDYISELFPTITSSWAFSLFFL